MISESLAAALRDFSVTKRRKDLWTVWSHKRVLENVQAYAGLRLP